MCKDLDMNGLKECLASLLHKAGKLDPSAIPDAKKKIPV